MIIDMSNIGKGNEPTIKTLVDGFKSPFTGGRAFLVKKMTSIKYRGENYEIRVKDYVCEDTGIEFTTTELDEATMNELYRQYCDRHHLKPLSTDITDCF